MTLDEIAQCRAAIESFKIPTNKLVVGLFKLLIAFQFTIIGSIIWAPWDVPHSTGRLIGFCFSIDLLRIFSRKDLLAIFLPSKSAASDTKTTFDESYGADKASRIFMFIYASVMPIAYLAAKYFSPADVSLSRYATIFPDVNNLQYYGFHNEEYKHFTVLFLILLHLVTALFLFITSTSGVIFFDVRSMSESRTLQKRQTRKKINFTVGSFAVILFILSYWGLHTLIFPSPPTSVTNDYDWAGPFAMFIYALCEFGIVSMLQSLNRCMVASIQAHSHISQEG